VGPPPNERADMLHGNTDLFAIPEDVQGTLGHGCEYAKRRTARHEAAARFDDGQRRDPREWVRRNRLAPDSQSAHSETIVSIKLIANVDCQLAGHRKLVFDPLLDAQVDNGRMATCARQPVKPRRYEEGVRGSQNCR
jgi:hypothetical protein